MMSKLIDDEDYYFVAAKDEEAVFTDASFAELTGGKGDDEEEIVIIERSIPEGPTRAKSATSQTYTNSALVNVTILSPCNSGERTHEIDRITPHCVVGQCTVENLGELFQNYSRQTSSNYGIGKDGRVGLYVEEKNRSWCTGGDVKVNGQSGSQNDQRAITIECASATYSPYIMNDCVYDKLVELCTDICKRYGKKKLLWIDNKEKAVAYEPASDEMILTAHRWFSSYKSCPGDWLYNRLGGLAKEVTYKLNPAPKKLYRVQIGAFSTKLFANNYAKKAQKKGFPAIVYAETVGKKTIYRVQCGAFSVKENAEKYAKDLKAAGFDAIITEVDVK